MKIPITGEDGKRTFTFAWQTNVGLLKEIHNIVKTLQDRVYGAVAQQHNINSKSLQVNVEADPSDVAGILGGGMSLDQLEAYGDKLKQLQTQIEGIASSDDTIIDAEQTSVNEDTK